MLIPKEVKTILTQLKEAGFDAYIVGGSVRDFLLGQEPKDWDVTTNATPEQVQKLFPENFYENTFLTVTVKTGAKKASLQEIEVTTYRSEGKYSNKRHPDQVEFAKTLEEDLSRRDFTVNAIAMSPFEGSPVGRDAAKKIIDPFDGQEDLKKKVIRTVGDPSERFDEDALRMLRAVRLATTLGFTIEEKTQEAIKKHSASLKAVSQERIRDELVKMVLADNAAQGIEQLRNLELLQYIIPELLENYGVVQNKHHIYDCYTHAIKALEYTAKKNYNLDVRLAALFHDIAKPRVKRGEGADATFYGHEMVGAKMTQVILRRLAFSNKQMEKITKLVKWHMFYYDVEQVTESSVRRLVRNVGPENIQELMQVREADRIGSGVPKAEPYKLRHLKYIIDKVSKDPISVGMLKVDGKDIMDVLKIEPGPKIGMVLDSLLGYVLDDPKKNTKAVLEAEIKKLGALPEKELKVLAEKSKEDKVEVQTQEDNKVKAKYWVK